MSEAVLFKKEEQHKWHPCFASSYSHQIMSCQFIISRYGLCVSSLVLKVSVPACFLLLK